MNSPKYQLNAEDLTKIAKVIGYSLASTLIATLLTILPQISFPAEYAVIGGLFVNIVNIFLVTAKKWIADN